MIYQEHDYYLLICDNTDCGYTHPEQFPTWEDAFIRAREERWGIIKSDAVWENVCPRCKTDDLVEMFL